MQQQQSEHSRTPLRIEVPPRTKNIKKIKKNGLVKAYLCQLCRQFQSFNISHVRKHTLHCKAQNEYEIMKEKKVSIKKQIGELKALIQQYKGQKIYDDYRQRIQKCEDGLKKYEAKDFLPLTRSLNFQAEAIAKDIIDEIGELMLGSLKIKLCKEVCNWLETGIDVRTMKYEICSKLNNKVQQINMGEMLEPQKVARRNIR